ncbi:membrane protein insertion efficiency factor YidD [Blattabacterium cuenoti]|uniref:membrane protein insertion efficiency factor YidD n=1 Tax=Blattabacterium cuenoti TaxID=1653831 RepID=UPI00163D0FF1|nr:membrane protein insertion efficiency factor YidD [Blattabacterium cuenoti]
MNVFKFFVIILIRIYQLFISPWIGNYCRYIPTCSEYMILSIKKMNFLKSIFMICKRLIRCNPWGGSGYDPPD